MNEVGQTEIAPESTRTNGVKIEKRNSDLGCNIGSKREDPISYEASDGGFSSSSQTQHHLPENRDGGSLYGLEKVRYLSARPGILLRQAIGDGLEPKVWIVLEVSLSIGVVVEALLDVFSVEECDFDVFKAQNLREFEHAIHRSLQRKRKYEDMRMRISCPLLLHFLGCHFVFNKLINVSTPYVLVSLLSRPFFSSKNIKK